MKNNRGITLIALVITIIVLIILAGVVIILSIGENGIFKKVEEAREKYEIETIREKVEIEIMNQEIEEITLGNEITVDLVLQELLGEGIFESIDKETKIGYIGDYEVKLKYNEEQKVVIEYIKKAIGAIATYTLEPKDYTNEEEVSILLTVKGGVKSVTKPDGLVVYPTNNEIALNYQVTSNGTYTFKIEEANGNKVQKNVIIDTIDRLSPNDFEITAECVDFKITVKGSTTDAEADENNVKSGIEKYEYYIKRVIDTEYTKYETNEIEIGEYGIYEIYISAYDKAGNIKNSNIITIEKPSITKRYVDYAIDLNGDGNTTNDWMIFYEEDGTTNPDYEGATYIIAASYVPYTKMQKSISNAGMKLYSGTYRIYWSSAPSYVTITDEVKSIFMYNYTGTTNPNAKCVSRLLNTAGWKDDFVTAELALKGGMAIGGPTINMWCASWNKIYPRSNEKLNATISGTGYKLNGVDTLSIASYSGYATDAPNVFFPTKLQESDATYSYWIASPSSYANNRVLSIRHYGTAIYHDYSYYGGGIRPLVYLPASIKLEQDEENNNLYHINYEE